MNNIDKMLTELKAQVEADIKKQKEADSQAKTAEKQPVAETENSRQKQDEKSAQIEAMLKELGKSVGVVSEGMVLVEGDGKKKKDFYICNHTLTQKEFEEVMGINPSWFQHGNPKLSDDTKQKLEADTSDYPVECVSWFDAIYYCNKRSIEEGLTPVYAKGKRKITDVKKWNYEPCKGKEIRLEIECNFEADGYRLPTEEEWEYAAKGGQKSEGYEYAGSKKIDEVAWYGENSGGVTHKVMQKKPNELGLYDMSGNVWEWCWGVCLYSSHYRYCRGGSYGSGSCEVDGRYFSRAYNQHDYIGFRIVRSSE